MAAFIKCIMAVNLVVVVLQFCSLGFQIHRWNEIVGAIFSIVVSFLGHLPTAFGENRDQWFVVFYALLLVADLLFQTVNMILLICLQWVVVQFCINLNYSVDVSEYGGIVCHDWLHFGWGEINYQDRALIVTIIMGVVILLRLAQIVLSIALFRQRAIKPTFYVNSDPAHLTRGHKTAMQA